MYVFAGGGGFWLFCIKLYTALGTEGCGFFVFSAADRAFYHLQITSVDFMDKLYHVFCITAVNGIKIKGMFSFASYICSIVFLLICGKERMGVI